MGRLCVPRLLILGLVAGTLIAGCGGGGSSDSDGVVKEAVIPGGSFLMGNVHDDSQGDLDEMPVHLVQITGFTMDVYEVTNARYMACVDAGVCTPPSQTRSSSRVTYYANPTYDDFPVIHVDWNQAKTFCEWEGKRLPTEAEWEYAARGGHLDWRFPWGNSCSGANANYIWSGDSWDNDTSPVGHYPPNGYGLYDMAGNVWEWTNDWYGSGYYAVSQAKDPQGPASGASRVFRGGCWFSDPWYDLRVAERWFDPPGTSNSHRGFRCASD